VYCLTPAPGPLEKPPEIDPARTLQERLPEVVCLREPRANVVEPPVFDLDAAFHFLPSDWYSGRGDGARFMKKKSPYAPFGYRFMTIARSFKCGRRYSATSV
jgi:hypothetical protein